VNVTNNTHCLIEPDDVTYNIYNGQVERLKEVYSYVPLTEQNSNLQINDGFFSFDFLGVQLTKNKVKRFLVSFTPDNKLEVGDYGIFSVKANGFEYWDKTHSSDFTVNNNVFYTLRNSLVSGIEDQSSNEFDLTNSGLTYDSGTDAIDFDGSSYGYTTEDFDFIQNTGDFTISFWLKLDSVSTDRLEIIMGTDSTSSSTKGFDIYYDNRVSQGSLQILKLLTHVGTGSGIGISLNGGITDTDLHHIVFTGESSTTNLELYIDGEVQAPNSVYWDALTSGDSTYGYHLGSTGNNAFETFSQMKSLGIWNYGLDEDEVLELYNGDENYNPYNVTSAANTSLYTATAVVPNVEINSDVYASIFSSIGNFTEPLNISVFIPVVVEKLGTPTTNEIYYRTVVNGVPSNEQKIISLVSRDDVRVGFYSARFQLPVGTNNLSIEVKRTGLGGVQFSNSTINIISSLTTNGHFDNFEINDVDEGVSSSVDWINITSGTLSDGSSENTYVLFVGSIENPDSENANNISLRFSDGVNHSDTLIRTVSTDTGSIFFNKMFYTDQDTIYIQSKADENFNINGRFYVLDFVDSQGELIQNFQTNNFSENIENISILNGGLMTIGSMSYYESATAELFYKHSLEDINASSTTYSNTVHRNFNAGTYGVLGTFYGFNNLDDTHKYNVGAEYVNSGGDDVQFFNLVAFQSIALNITQSLIGDVSVSINENDYDLSQNVTGSCSADNVIETLSINNTDFVFSGSYDNFVFTYNGTVEGNISLNVTCSDLLNNSGYDSVIIDTTQEEEEEPTTPAGTISFNWNMNSELEWFTCPSNPLQFGLLTGFFILAFVFYGIGLTQRNVIKPIFCFIAGFMMFLLPLYIVACDILLGIIVWVLGLAMLYTSFTLPFHGKDK